MSFIVIADIASTKASNREEKDALNPSIALTAPQFRKAAF
jgi:hypothetical protein